MTSPPESDLIDKQYISDLNKNYFQVTQHDCSKISHTDSTFAYITGSFVHYTKTSLQHLIEYHIGWRVTKTLNGANVCVIGSIIRPEMWTRINTTDIKIYTEKQIISLINKQCKIFQTGKFLRFTSENPPRPKDATKKFENERQSLWSNAFTPTSLYDIAGHQEEISLFYEWASKGVGEPLLIAYPAGRGVCKAIELALLSLDYELAYITTLEPKTEYKKHRTSKFTRIAAYKLDKLTNSQIQILSNLHEMTLVLVPLEYQLKEIDDNTSTANITLPSWMDKVKFKKLIFYPPPPEAVAYRIQDVLDNLNQTTRIEDIKFLLEHCKTAEMPDMESTLIRLMFILAKDTDLEDAQGANSIKWYITNHLKEDDISNEGDSAAEITLNALNDKFDNIWNSLYNKDCNIIETSEKLSRLLYFYEIFTRLAISGQTLLDLITITRHI